MSTVLSSTLLWGGSPSRGTYVDGSFVDGSLTTDFSTYSRATFVDLSAPVTAPPPYRRYPPRHFRKCHICNVIGTLEPRLWHVWHSFVTFCHISTLGRHGHTWGVRNVVSSHDTSFLVPIVV